MFPYTKPPVGAQINPLQPLSKGLVGCWLFNEGAGSLANDVSVYKNNGRLTNMNPNVQGSGWGGSEFGGGLDFDANDDYVEIPDSTSLDVSDGITISAWINASTFGTSPGNPIFNKWYDGSKRAYYFNAVVGGELRIGISDSVGGSQVENTTLNVNMNTNQWYHVAMVWSTDLGEVNIYKNGEYIETIGSGATSLMYNNSMNPRIGRDYSTRYFDGSIGSVHVHNRASSADEIAWLYREPYAMFEPAFNPALLYSAAPPVGAIMNQFQKANIGADLYNGVFA